MNHTSNSHIDQILVVNNLKDKEQLCGLKGTKLTTQAFARGRLRAGED